jgi:hypothetical protein
MLKGLQIAIAILVVIVLCISVYNFLLLTELKKQTQDLNIGMDELYKRINPRPSQMRVHFEQQLAKDKARYSESVLSEIEDLYQKAIQNLDDKNSIGILKTVIEKYPESNRAGCSALYLGQCLNGNEREKYLKLAIDRYDDSFYGDGVQVGAFARYMLAMQYRNQKLYGKSDSLLQQIQSNYPDAIDHSGNSLMDMMGSTGSMGMMK